MCSFYEVDGRRESRYKLGEGLLQSTNGKREGPTRCPEGGAVNDAKMMGKLGPRKGIKTKTRLRVRAQRMTLSKKRCPTATGRL